MKRSGQWSVVGGQKAAFGRAASMLLPLALSVSLAMSAVASARRQATPARLVETDSSELYQSLLDLQSPWTVMCVAAHPDDEDGATLTVLRRKYGVHTVTVFSTYGEGGQNATGPELYEELGAIRARETEEASRIQGSEPHFLGLTDFGFSKSAEEAFRVWGRQEALRRMVLKIRQLRPDVIITNHDTEGGHGHHQATARLLVEAFDAAGDPRRFPEQLRGGVAVWQAERLFVRAPYEGGAGSKAAEEEARRAGKLVSINPNEPDPIRGSTYAEQALQALRRHASQGPWPQAVPAGGWPIRRYRLARSAKTAATLSANAQTFLDGLSLPPKIQERVTPLATKALLPLYASQRSSEQVFRALLQLKKAQAFVAPKGTKDEQRFNLMGERLQRALEVASGVSMTVALDEKVLVPNTPATFSVVISNRSNEEIQLKPRQVILSKAKPGEDEIYSVDAPERLAPKSKVTLSLRRDTPADEPVNVPHAEHLYDELLFGQRFDAVAKVNVDGASFFIHATTKVNVAPAVEIASITPSPLVLTPGTPGLSRHPASPGTGAGDRPAGSYLSATFTLRLTNHQARTFKGEVTVEEKTSPKTESRAREVTLAANEVRELEVRREGKFLRVGLGNWGERTIPNALTFGVVGADRRTPLTRRTVRIVWSDARVVPGLRVGYIRSFDETLRHSLAALGVEAKELTVDDVRADDLSRYHAIIIDNRGYQAHPELVNANSRLLDYASSGGTLIVFYHRTNEWNPDPQKARPQLAPYPIILGTSRVTDEAAAVEFADARHPLLNFPNKITQEDFAGWVQERGLYYPQSWDPRYSALLATSDEGEAPLRGGLLAVEYGRGRYVYTSMVWYRQLRAGLPGAYRMLANMISYGRERNQR